MDAAALNSICYATIGNEEPWTLRNYLKVDGYRAWRKILDEKISPAAVIEEIKASGLRGRGGAGFPTGLKWSFMNPDGPNPKYVVCNSDESEPGTCKDRDILRFNPHALVEGMAIACYAMGAAVGYNYVRGEFMDEPYRRFETALEEAYQEGLLGRNIRGAGVDIDHPRHHRGRRLHLRRGDGPAGIPGGQTGQAPLQAAVSGAARLVRPPHHREQHGEFRRRAGHHPQGGAVVRQVRRQEQQRPQVFFRERPCGAARQF